MTTGDSPALSLSWTFGSSVQVPHNVLNLSDGFSDRLCYVAAHTGIIYDKKTRKQVFLQGHGNAIACLASTEDRSTIITADVGNESLMVLWDSTTGAPTKIVKQPHAYGTLAMDVAPGGAWLASLSAPSPTTGEQEIALWSMASLLSDPAPRPAVLTAIPAGDTQLSVRFNMNDINELTSNGKRRVYFWRSQATASARFKYYSPPLRSKDFKQSVGDFIMSVFVPGSTQALTATSDGDLVVWDEQGITAQVGTRATDRRAIKLMRIHQQAVTFLGTIGDYIVSGGQDGFIRFYDPLLRIVAWFEDLSAGPITGLSFSLAMPMKSNAPESSEVLNKFVVPDFVACTGEGKMVSVLSSAFEDYDVERRKGSIIIEPIIPDVCSVACHPTQPEVAVLGASGQLQRWDMISHNLVSSRTFTKAAGAHVAYSRDGSFLVVGLDGGFVNILNVDDLSDLHIARNTPHAITMLATCTTGRHVAVADSAHQVLLYSYLPYKHIMRWDYIGKARVHHANVVGLCFGETPSGQTRLFSIGADKRIVEYDLINSTPNKGLMLSWHHDMPSLPTPTAMTFAPPLPYFKHHSNRTLLLISDDSYKLKLYDPDLKACVSTFLGPTFAGPLQRLLMFKSVHSEGAFLAYSCADRVVGLVAWPLDGDPARTMGLVAHPAVVLCLAISHNGRKLVTAGHDGTVNMWDVSTQVLEAQANALAGPDRWETVLDDPVLLEDMKAYFTFAGIKAQGEDYMEARDTSGLVPVSSLPDVMRAVGFYLSQVDVDEIQQAITFLAQSQDKEELTHIDFQTCLRLYYNHRPLFDASTDDLVAAFQALGAAPSHKRLTREALITQLQHLGETMTLDELVGALLALTGAERVSDAIPHSLDAPTFASTVLGFEEQDAGLAEVQG